MGHQCEKSKIEIKSSKLEALVKATFHVNCDYHGQKDYPSNYFCWDCRELKPLCEICTKTEHSNHTVKQVFKASRTSAVRVDDVKKLFEIAETQPHRNNSQDVIYFYKRALEGGAKRKHIRTDKSRCQNCGYEMTKDGYKFCSLQCQSQYGSEIVEEEECLGLISKGKRKNLEEEKDKTLISSSLSKRSRKGIPFRAPFY